MLKIRASDGTDIAVWVHDFLPAWIGEEDKKTIIMHHGSVNDARVFNQFIPILTHKYRVVRFDERGMGQSKMASGTYKPSTKRFVEDVIDIADAIKLKKFHLYCQGSGGMIGVPFAVSHPERLLSLTLCQTPYQLPRALIDRYRLGEETIGAAIRKYGFEDWNRRVPGYHMFNPSKVDPRQPEWLRRFRAENSSEVAAERYDWAFSIDLRDTIKDISVPTLLINSAGSVQTPTEVGEFFQRQNPLIRIATIDGDFGQALATVIPDRLAQTHLDFISSLDESEGRDTSGGH
jgi:pimeloyl-ACP methyl ester carboxylesterase